MDSGDTVDQLRYFVRITASVRHPITMLRTGKREIRNNNNICLVILGKMTKVYVNKESSKSSNCVGTVVY